MKNITFKNYNTSFLLETYSIKIMQSKLINSENGTYIYAKLLSNRCFWLYFFELNRR